IYADDGHTLLATNVRKRVDGRTLYFRRYPTGPLAPEVVGYSTQSRSQAGLERSYNDYLTGSNSNLSTVLHTTFDRLKGVTVKGNDLYTTINPRAQRLANQLLAGKCAAAVALEPSTGKVFVLASSPTYDPNLVEQHFGRIAAGGGPCKPNTPLFDRATQGLYAPGSTFKVVTASAALDTGRFTPDSTFFDPGYCIEYGQQISNARNPDQTGPESFGTVNLTTALQHSINAVFCKIGMALGAGPIVDYMKRYGFYSVPPLETPLDERVPSGRYKGHHLDRSTSDADPGRLAFGQERLLVTPFPRATVAGAPADHPKVAVAVVVENGGFGGHSAAPIAKALMQAILGRS